MKDLKKYAEIFLIVASFMGIGYFIDPADPCFIYGKINLSLFLVSVLVLFYGDGALLISLALYAIAFKVFYENPPVYKFLQIFALGILLYVFYFIWHRRVREAKVKEEYFDNRLKENTMAFYALKASYDKLERDLLTKPFTLSNALKEILSLLKKSEETAKDEFLKLLRELYFVKKAFIVVFKKEEKSSEFESYMRDPLFKKAFMKMKPLYADLSNKENRSDYLCVIPVDLQEKKAFLVIEKMPFTFFTKNALLEIAVVFTYFMQSLEREKFYMEKECGGEVLSRDFSVELCKLREIYENYKIPSSLIVFKSKNLKFMKKIFFLVQKEKRGIDMVDTSKDKDGYYVISLLFPFMERREADSFFERIKEKARKDGALLGHFDSKSFIHKVSLISSSKNEKILK